jgi:membrane dipeptidase
MRGIKPTRQRHLVSLIVFVTDEARVTLALMIPIFDGHNDTLLSLIRGERGQDVTFFSKSNKGHVDFPRAKKAGFAGGFFAVYSPSEGFDLEAHMTTTETGYTMQLSPPRDRQLALQDTLVMANLLFKIERESKGKFKVVRTIKDLQQCLKTGVMAAIFHIEGAEAIDKDLETLELLYQAGLRSLGPVWSRQNTFGSGVPFSFPLHPNSGDGLTNWGKTLVKTCNDLGIMIDLSHITEKGFWDVYALSNKPLVATHSNAYALSNSPRNLTDDQLRAIRDTDGMVGLNFAVSFLREDGHPNQDTPISRMVDHIDYLVDKVGISRVGLGSDFDGARIPNEIKDVTGLPKLVKALGKRGYDEKALEKICYKNWLRVLQHTW